MLFVIIPLAITIAGLSFAGMVVYKKIPKDAEFFDGEVAKENFGPTFYQKALSAFYVKSKETAIKISTKLIYKLKITSLKTDNFFGRLLQEMKSHKENMKQIVSEVVPETRKEEMSVKPSDFIVSAVVDDYTNEDDRDLPKSDEPAEKRKSRFEIQEQQLINQLAYNPKDVSAYKKLGWLYLENNKPVQARQSFKMAVKLGSKDKILMAKLLEIGGVLHKEGMAQHSQTEMISEKTQPIRSKESKDHRARAKKLKVKRF